MTFYELLLSLRKRLIDAQNLGNRQDGEDLFVTLAMLQEISYEKQNEALTSLIVDLLEAARDVAMGVLGKSQIPSIEDIAGLFPPTEKAS
jgi:hypothetical protein